MQIEEFFKLVPAKQFFEQYAPTVKRYYHKMRGIDGNGRPIDFTPDDREAMKAGSRRLAADLKKVRF